MVGSDMASIYVSFLFSAAKAHAQAIARGATIGTTNSFLDGRSPYTHRPPIGTDRMITLDGKDPFIVRNLSDGTQQQLDPMASTVLRTFECNPKHGAPAHYRKQKNEQVRLIVGHPKQVVLVHTLFELRHAKGWGYYKIAKELNDADMASPTGAEWYANTVRRVLLNPIYIGLGIRYREATGIYFMGGAAQPKATGVDLAELATRKSVKPRRRPRE